MILRKVDVEDCRNLLPQSLLPDEALTVIGGQNGQGKTNLLECIWLLTGAKSFRGARDIDIVQREKDFGKIEGTALCHGQEKKIKITIYGEKSGKRGRSAKVNDVPYPRVSSIAGIFTAVVFEPGHLSLVKNGPEGRRRFLDAALCQLYPSYIATLRRFSRAVTQKNALLKQARFLSDIEDLLDTFDEEISLCGTEITHKRKEYIELAGPVAQSLYSEISGNREKMKLSFLPCCQNGELSSVLKKSRAADLRAGHCTSGPQREDFEATINETSARVYGSQGQQRSVVLSLKLAEAAAAREITGEHPVLLLDDVLSELDEKRQEYLLSRIDGKQSFVTTCDVSAFTRAAGRVVRVENGRIFSD